VTAAPVPVLLHQALASLSVTEWTLAAGFDGTIVDLQHGEVGLEDACTMLRAIPRSCAHAYARVGSVDPAVVLRLLDSGARGIIAPTIETAAETRALVEAVKYPPLGRRSLGPSRPALYSGESYTAAGNAAVQAIAQIETARGVENAEAIVSVPGLDSIYIGPADLAVSFGLPGRGDWTDGPVRDAILHLSEVTRAHGVSLGIYSGAPAYAADLIEQGLVDYVGLGIDLVFLSRAAQDAVLQLRGAR
jgi:2-keto-3-deoxy-L-rhamnonate aldolase RhmA